MPIRYDKWVCIFKSLRMQHGTIYNRHLLIVKSINSIFLIGILFPDYDCHLFQSEWIGYTKPIFLVKPFQNVTEMIFKALVLIFDKSVHWY